MELVDTSRSVNKMSSSAMLSSSPRDTHTEGGNGKVDDYDAHQAKTRTRWFVLGHDEAAAELLKGPGPVLDAGCATGSLGRVLARRNIASVGVDLSLERLVKAERGGSPGGFIRTDLTRLPFAGEAFDRIATLRVLQHMPLSIRIQALEELSRVARPGGLLLVSVYNALQAHVFGMQRGDGKFRSGIYYHTFELAEFEGELAASGWQIEKVSGYGMVLATARKFRGGLRLYKALAPVVWRLEKLATTSGGRSTATRSQYLFVLARKVVP